MRPKDLLNSLKSKLEIESQFTDNLVVVDIEDAPGYARAMISIEIEGKDYLFEVSARPLGVTNSLAISR